MKWIPPIPYGALYSKPARDLGHALALLGWCYDNVTTDGWLDLNLQEVAGDLDTPYRTIKLWWQALRSSPFIATVIDRGRKGLKVRMADDWIDWRVLKARQPEHEQPISNGTHQGQDAAPFPQIGPEMGDKWAGNGAESRPSADAYKGTHPDQESHESHPPTPSQPPRATRAPDRAMVMMMVSKGIKSEKALNAIASMGLDLGTVEQSIDNLLADRTGIGAIVKLLQTAPPEPGKPYPRARAPAGRMTVDLPPAPERSSKTVLSANERRQLLEQHRNGSS